MTSVIENPSIKMTTEYKEDDLFEIETDPYVEPPWDIIESYFKGQQLERFVRHQLESYNNFVGYQIIKTIEMFNPVHIASEQDFDIASNKYALEIFITFENFNIYRAQIHENNGAIKLMFPQEARLRNFTYSASTTIDINIKYVVRTGATLENVQTFHKTIPRVHIGKLPIMLKSNICVLNQYKHFDTDQTGECKFDAGGYFIINGSEKTVLGQERAAENRVNCFNIEKNDTKYLWKAEIKSVPDFKCISPKQISMYILSKNNGFGFPMVIEIPRIKQPIPLFIVFRALGVISDKEICEKILLNVGEDNKTFLEALQSSIIESNKYLSQEECIKYITNYAMYTPINMDKETGARKKYEFTLDILNNDLFPHCQSMEQKIYFMGYMANKLLMAYFELIKADDRDSYLNKRIDLTGTLLNNLYRNYFNKLVKDMEKQIIREINTGSWRSKDNFENIINMTNIYKIIKATTIENGIKRALSTGDFGTKHNNTNKVGVAQVYNRLNYVSSLSHSRRISTPVDKSGKLIPPRKLHNTSWGYLCLTGDTEILMSDRITIKKIKDMQNGDKVITVNPETLFDEPSDIHSFFCKMPDKLFKITTISGRTIKATANHPFLVNNNGNPEWKNLENLKLTDKMIIRHMVKNIDDENVSEKYKIDLLELTLLSDKINIMNNGCISIPILEIVEIEPELVYDFTTRSDNHSFVASSFVTHNCPAETPEGQSVGVVKNISYMTHITIYSNSGPLYEYIIPNIIKIEDASLNPAFIYDKVKVFINGVWVGISLNPEELFLSLKDKKYKGIINIYTSIIFNYKLKEIRVCNDGGRLTRPLLRTKNKNILINKYIINKLKKGEYVWDNLLTSSLLNDSVLEYIDPEEQSWSIIATKPKDIVNPDNKLYKYTHCEIHPSTMFGVLASCIPFPEHNQSPRNTYQCLDENETVLLSNGTKIPIKNIKIGDKVSCFNPNNLNISTTTVINHYVRETDKKIYKLTTLSGREIIATYDHKFMTIDGWCYVENMRENQTMIGLYPFQNNENSIENGSIKNCIIDVTQFINLLIEYGLSLTYANYQVESLTKIGLLPLYSDDIRLPILARIFGYLLANGTININERNYNKKYTSCSFNFVTENDLISFENDLELCGLNNLYSKYTQSSKQLNQVSGTYAVTYNGLLPSLLISVGVSFEKKTETEQTEIQKEIPNWILNGKKIIKREFLSGFQCENDCRIYWNKIIDGYNFICEETSKEINTNLKEPFIKFMTQCIKLLEEFNIEVSNVNCVFVEENRVKISYKILDKQSNLIKYYDNIGYRYATTKNVDSFLIIEYLKYEYLLFQQPKKNNEHNTLIYNNIEYWFTQVKIINGILFMPIKLIEEVSNRLVSDITVESENHSFIAGNNFLSSNCAQGKQAMGVYVSNYENRMDKTAYVLNYPMKPLVDTRIMNLIHLNKIPSGSQLIVAIMTHTGYNQEDSLLLNKGSIDRGMSLTTIYHTEKDEDKQKINGDDEIRCKPDKTKTKGVKMGNYNKVNSKGVIPENTLVENRDIIIAKVIPIKENRNDHTKLIKFEDQSKIYKTIEETYIDKNYIDRNGEGYKFAKVRLRTLRKPVIGDKFSSRHGQKGTVGNIIPEHDMPYTADGIRPDIIINPHAIPSRMTIGQLKETALGKVLVELGLFGDGTSFGNFELADICDLLLKAGCEAYGNELMYNALTGEQVEYSVFTGPVFYQRLKHMVNDKSHSRSIGPMVNLTRQPAEGRSRDGGLRFGEMERDCMVSHGAARFTRGRMYDASDKYSVYICKTCGLIASYNDKMHIHLCRTCGNRADFAYVEIPYACKLLFQELNTMNIAPRMITEG